MDEKTTYTDLVKELEDGASPLFAGSLAYIQIEESLAMLIKLLNIKLKKPSPLTNNYKAIISISKVVMPQAHKMITEDGENFNKLRTSVSPEEKKQVVDAIFPSSLAFLVNLFTIANYLKGLIIVETSSIRGDYLMIFGSICATYGSLSSILKYEVKKMPDGQEKEDRMSRIEANDAEFTKMANGDDETEESE